MGRLFILVVLINASAIVRFSYACGGGWAPYIPPTASGKASASGAGRLQVFEKGVSYNLFDPKALQPLVRNIVLSGNLRKQRSGSKPISHHTPESLKKHGKNKLDSLTCENEPAEKDPTEDNPNAVLNVHRLH